MTLRGNALLEKTDIVSSSMPVNRISGSSERVQMILLLTTPPFL